MDTQRHTNVVEIGIKEILSKLEEVDLLGLAFTVTQGLLKNKINTKEEAVDAIIKYSPDVLSILKRRAVTRDILFLYLYNNNIIVTLPALKEKLIGKICSFWNLPPVNTSNGSEGTSANNSIQNPGNSEVNPKNNTNGSEVNTMAQRFSEWFYSLMNQKEVMGHEHYFADAKLKLHLISSNQFVSDEVSTPEEIVQLLFKTKSEHNLYFNLNCNSEGVQGRVDSHGLVMVMACGTLHTNTVCAGVFEQVFALARDPYCDNNWKIKNTELNLRNKSDLLRLPNLGDSELTSSLLALPES